MSALRFALCVPATILAWWLLNRPVDIGPLGSINSVSYAPFRPGQSPLTQTFATPAQIDEDLALLARSVRNIRTYAASEDAGDIAGIAARHGLTLWLGIWLSSDRARNQIEIAAGIRTANAHPGTVTRVVVGNEVLLRRELPAAEIAAALDQVRAAVHVPVTYADVWEFWEQAPELAAHVDIVTVHLLPYWENDPVGIDGAVAHVGETHRRIAALFPGKPVAIGETGWPSGGRWRQEAAPGRVNQARFIQGVLSLSAREGFDTNIVEAFDQDWKSANEGTVGARWGLWTAGREPKLGLRVSEDPSWRTHAALALITSVLLSLPLAKPTRPVLMILLGNALMFAWVGTVPIAFSPAQQAAAAINLAAQAALAWHFLHGPPPSRPAMATAAMLRHPAWLDFGALSFLFAFAAAVLQLLLVIDPRYRDMPTPSFAVPIVVVAAMALAGTLTRGGGGRGDWALGLVLAGGALASTAVEGLANRQALVWNAAALLLAMPWLLRVMPPSRAARPA